MGEMQLLYVLLLSINCAKPLVLGRILLEDRLMAAKWSFRQCCHSWDKLGTFIWSQCPTAVIVCK